MAEEDGGPAFPYTVETASHHGVSVREYFALHVIMGRCANPQFAESVRDLISGAYLIADAMLKERTKV